MNSTTKCGGKKATATTQQQFLNTVFSKRRKRTNGVDVGQTTLSKKANSECDKPASTAHSDDELTRLAVAELDREAHRGAIRAESIGPAGWRRIPQANKRFLNTTIRSAVAHNRRQTGGASQPPKCDVELDAIIASQCRRERRLVCADAKFSFRKPKRTTDKQLASDSSTKANNNSSRR